MRTSSSVNDLESRAIAALSKLLGEVSVIKLKDIQREPQGSGNDIGLVAHVDVLGHSHTLACEVKSSAQPEGLRSTLRETRESGAPTRVIIAPYMSPEAQALCKESHAGFIDLEGNARIALGEVFIGKRSIAPRAEQQIAAMPTQAKAPLKQYPSRSGQAASKGATVCQA